MKYLLLMPVDFFGDKAFRTMTSGYATMHNKFVSIKQPRWHTLDLSLCNNQFMTAYV